MKTQLLSAVFAIAVAALVLGLRHLILSLGKKKIERENSSQVFTGYVECNGESGRRRSMSDDETDYEAGASPIRVEEFLAELRAKAANNRGDEEINKSDPFFRTARS